VTLTWNAGTSAWEGLIDVLFAPDIPLSFYCVGEPTNEWAGKLDCADTQVIQLAAGDMDCDPFWWQDQWDHFEDITDCADCTEAGSCPEPEDCDWIDVAITRD